MYELIRSNDPRGRLTVVDIDAETDLSAVDVVFGVGVMARAADVPMEASAFAGRGVAEVAVKSAASAETGGGELVREAPAVAPGRAASSVGHRGYRSIDRFELADDVLSHGQDLDPRMIVQSTLPALLKTARFVPVYKYLREGGYLGEDGEIAGDVPDSVLSVVNNGIASLLRGSSYEHKRKGLADSGVTLADLVERNEPIYVLYHTQLLPLDRIDIFALRDFLIRNGSFLSNVTYQSQYFKMVCLYDLLMYRGI